MNQADFETTKLYAKKAQEAYKSAPPPPAPEANLPPSYLKPEVKVLTKAEKIMLAAGGVASLGLGAVVIANMPEDNAPSDGQKILGEPETDVPLIEGVGTAAATAISTSLDITPTLSPEPSPTPSTRPTVVPPPESRPHTQQVVHQEESYHSLRQIPDHLLVAHTVTDEMSYGEALGTARAETGPGGLFVWNDTYYATFTEGEWQSLPEAQKDKWLAATEAVMEPAEPLSSTEDEYVVIAERGDIVWTGIDRNGDGIAEVLIAQAGDESPIVMMDTDGDGQLDTRYSLSHPGGEIVASALEPSSFTLAEISRIPEMEKGSLFASASYEGAYSGQVIPVTIIQDNGSFLIGIDLDQDSLVDVVTLREPGSTPYVALDLDGDGQVETSFVYDPALQTVEALEIEPLQPMTVTEEEDSGPLQFTHTETEWSGMDGLPEGEEEKANPAHHAAADEAPVDDLFAHSQATQDTFGSDGLDTHPDYASFT